MIALSPFQAASFRFCWSNDSNVTCLLGVAFRKAAGVDPSEAQWKQIVAKCQERKLVPVLDNAYQGYASGSLEQDRFDVTHICIHTYMDMYMYNGTS